MRPGHDSDRIWSGDQPARRLPVKCGPHRRRPAPVLLMSGLLDYDRASPSAESGDLIGNGEVGFMRAAVGVADAVSELVDGEQAVGFDDFAFAVDPGGLDRVQPGALDRQIVGTD